MPHRVSSFFKASIPSSIESQVISLKKSAAKASRRRDSPSRSARGYGSSERVHSCASPLEEMDDSQAPAYTAQCHTPGVMAERTSTSSLDSQPHNQHHHRISFPGLHLGRSSSKDNYFHRSPASLDWKLESPPIVFYGDAESSTGALVSGQLFLNVMEEEGHEFESFNATLSVYVTQKRPFVAHCHDCSTQVTELKRWTFLERPLLLAKGWSPSVAILIRSTPTNHMFSKANMLSPSPSC